MAWSRYAAFSRLSASVAPGRNLPSMAPDSPSAQTHLLIRGAREHNLKNIDLEIPRDRLVVFTELL